jgi:carbon storage regulator
VLVVRRRPGEVLLIGDSIEVEVLDCSSTQVKIGIRAPKEVIVLRQEIYITGHQNHLAAAMASPAAMHRLLGTLR